MDQQLDLDSTEARDGRIDKSADMRGMFVYVQDVMVEQQEREVLNDSDYDNDTEADELQCDESLSGI